MAPAAPENKRIRWDSTITYGNVLTAISMTLVVLVWGIRLESRVDMMEARTGRSERIQDTGASQVAGMRDTLSRLQADQSSLLRSVTRIEGHLDRAQAPPQPQPQGQSR